ncbi:MAG: hypothetical protein HOV80_19955 [Polyangiaceae bacterium]|nr:hypothetical protein [Polyangiaceae bacterium]
MFRHVCVLAAAVALTSAAACGGKVVFVEDGGEDGQGGAGTTSSTSKSTGTTTKTTNNNSVTTHSATFGSTGVVGTSGTGLVCDTGVPGDGGSDVCVTCQDCSFQGPCFEQANACGANSECLEFNDCLANCSEPDCQAKCDAAFPVGSQLLYDLAFCVLCDACPINCGGCNEFP